MTTLSAFEQARKAFRERYGFDPVPVVEHALANGEFDLEGGTADERAFIREVLAAARGDRPVGLNCPECRQPPVLVLAGGTQAFCGNEAGCRIVMWDPAQTWAELAAEGHRRDRPDTADGAGQTVTEQRAPVTDAEAAAEARWANTTQGKAAFTAAWGKLREAGLHQYVDATQLSVIIYAAHLAVDPLQRADARIAALAGGQDEPEEDPPPPAHLHYWAVLRAQPHTQSVIPFGPPVPGTIVLIRCTGCGEPDSLILPGEWTTEDLSLPGWERSQEMPDD
jgi:hypothetical protein